jgi:hypothetical protein
LCVSLTRNQRLRQIVTQLGEQAHRVHMLTLRLRPKPVGLNRDHAMLEGNTRYLLTAIVAVITMARSNSGG